MAQKNNSSNDKWMQLARKADGYRMPLSDEKLDAMFASISSRVDEKARWRKMLWPILIGTASAAAVLAIVLSGVLHNPKPEVSQSPVIAKNADEIEKNAIEKEDEATSATEGMVGRDAQPPGRATEGMVGRHAQPLGRTSEGMVGRDAQPPGRTSEGMVERDAQPPSPPLTLMPNEQIESVAQVVESTTESEDSIRAIPSYTVKNPKEWYVAERAITEDDIMNEGPDRWSVSLYTTASLGGTLDNPYTASPMWGGGFAKPGLKLVGQRWHSAVPVTVGLNVQYRLTKRLGIETGLVYTYIKQHRTLYYSDNTQVEDRLTTHYIGIPTRVNYLWWQCDRFEVYTALGGSLSVPVSTQSSVNGVNGPVYTDPDKYEDKGVQWSAEAGIGAQYRLYPTMSIYVEPGARYYFNTSKRPGMFDDHPFCFSIQAGFRFGF